MSAKTIVVTVRHPDFENNHHTFGEPIVHVDIDLGSSFDGSHLGEEDWDDILDWAVGLYEEADSLMSAHGEVGEEAAWFIRGIANETLAECMHHDDDRDPGQEIRRERRRREKERA